MKSKPRWMKSVIEAAKEQKDPLPFARRPLTGETLLKSALSAKA